MRSLDSINPRESGLNSFDKNEFSQKLKDYSEQNKNPNYPENYLKILGLFLLGRYDALETLLSEDPSLISSYQIKAIKILNLIQSNKPVTNQDIFPFSSQELNIRKKISKKISAHIIDLYDAISKNISSIPLTSDLWALKPILPEIVFYYGKYILENKISNEYKRLEEELTQAIPLTENDELNKENELEQVYLRTFFYRTIGDAAQAEAALLKYRDIYKPVEQAAHIKSQANTTFYPPDQVLNNWDKILTEADAIQKEVERKAGLLNSTCDYFKCSDCCSNTFPVMTLTEFKFLEQWMKDNNYPLEKIQERSELIQQDYEKKYGKRLTLIDKELAENDFRGSENPYNYKFSCPFLEGGKCSIYHARPLICRGFGLSTDNNISVKTCKYYLAQYRHNSSLDNERYAYDLRAAEMLAASSDKYLTGAEHLKGTIVAWFSKN